MSVFEWLLLLIILISSHSTYQKQEHWLDRQIAKIFRYMKSLFKS